MWQRAFKSVAHVHLSSTGLTIGGFRDSDDVESEVTVLDPGEYDLGIADKNWQIQVICGEILLPTPDKEEISHTDTPLIFFNKGENIRFRCCCTTVIFCRHPHSWG